MSWPITFYVIFQNPKDYPKDCYVLRRQYVTATERDPISSTLAPHGVRVDETDPRLKYDNDADVADTLDEIRDLLPPGLSRLGRHAADDPAILEVWM